MVNINQKLIDGLVERVASKVEETTRWNLNLSDLEIKIIKRNQVWEEGTKKIYSAAGVDTEPKTDDGKNIARIRKILNAYGTLCQYEVLTDTLHIVPQNFGGGTNEDALSIFLAHELTHYGQFSNYPNLKKRYFDLIKKMYPNNNAFDPNEYENERSEQDFETFMRLIEGDAVLVQELLNKSFYRDSKFSASLLARTFDLFFKLQKNKERKIMSQRYLVGNTIVKNLYNSKGREGINSLYRLSNEQLFNKFQKLENTSFFIERY